MEQSSTATATLSGRPLTCAGCEHRHGFFHGSVASGRGGEDTWTGTMDIRDVALQQVAPSDQSMTIDSKRARRARNHRTSEAATCCAFLGWRDRCWESDWRGRMEAAMSA